MKRLTLLFTLFLVAVPAGAQHRYRSHNGKFLCTTKVTGSLPLLVFNSTTDKWCPSATLNPGNNDTDFCIEGDTDANLFCTDAGNDRVCISCTDPASLFDVRGDAGAAGTVTLSTAELTVVDGNTLGCTNFQAPLESSGTDAILVAAAICAESSATFSATVNTTDLVFKNGVSEAAVETVRFLANGIIVTKSRIFWSRSSSPTATNSERNI